MIRQLQSSDQQQWRGLWEQYLAFDGSKLEAEVHEATWSRLSSPDGSMHGALAFGEGKAVGFVHYVFHPSTWSLRDVCYLQDLFVAPDVRGQGYGRALITHVYGEASQAGSPNVYWQTQTDNATAIALYEKIAQRSRYIQFRKEVAV